LGFLRLGWRPGLYRAGGRASQLLAHGIADLPSLSQTSPDRIIEIIGGSLSQQQAKKIVEYAQKELISEKSNTWPKRLWRFAVEYWKLSVAIAAGPVLLIELFNGIFSAGDNISKKTWVKVFYGDSIESTYKNRSAFEISTADTSVTNIGIPYRELPQGEWAICGALPFLVEPHAAHSVKQLTLIFDVEYSSKKTLAVAMEAGYGKYHSNYSSSCAYGEKTLFADTYGRTTLKREFIHGNNSTRVVYNFQNMTPDESAVLSVVIPLLPNAFPVYGNPPKQPFVNSPGESDFSHEALEAKEITLYADPIKLSVSYILDGPRQEIGSLLIYVHPVYLNADLVFRSFQIAKANGYSASRSLSQIWSVGNHSLLLQTPEVAIVKKELFEQLIDESRDEVLRKRQYTDNLAILTLLPADTRISYVSEKSKVIASLKSVLSTSGAKISFATEEYNKNRNAMRTELLLSHQFPRLFQEYLNSED
jgi:hypothetical protein